MMEHVPVDLELWETNVTAVRKTISYTNLQATVQVKINTK